MNDATIGEQLGAIKQEFLNGASAFADRKLKELSDLSKEVCQSEIERVFFVATVMRIEAFIAHDSVHAPTTLLVGHQTSNAVNPHKRGRRFDFVAKNWSGYFNAGPELELWGLHSAQSFLIWPQAEIAGLHPDFALRRVYLSSSHDTRKRVSPVILIECDGHDFHERTRQQASRDKARDRLFAAAGYTLLRFTGSEIWQRPRQCAEEAFRMLTEAPH